MNNAQLAAARKVMNQFSDLRIRKDGWKLTPFTRAGVAGATVEVTDTMTEATVRNLLENACEALRDG